jgi:hypothetical protein
VWASWAQARLALFFQGRNRKIDWTGDAMKSLSEGSYVKHFQYGCGVVTESEGDRTTIDFDLHGMKKFVTSIMVVEPAEGVPPKRSRRRKKAVSVPLAAAKVAK